MGKTTNKKLIIFMIMIFCMFISFYSYRVNANQSNNIIQYDPDLIKILEIQPGNKFYLGDARYDSTIGELSQQNVIATNGESKRVAITHMPMTQFISMVDELNGQYDVVVLGRRIDGLEQKYSGDTALGTQYRDYTNPTTQKKGYLPQLWWGQTEAHKNNVQNDISVIDGAKMTEYYAENDITDKRAKEIIKMIQNDQLVYVDYDIYPSKKPNKSTDGVANASAYKEINETKLYKTFDTDNFDYPIWVSDSVENREYNTWKQKIKLKSLSSYNNNSFLKEIVDDYINNSSDNKRPKIKQLKTPKSDEKSSEKGEKKNRDMDYTITMGQNGHFKLKLYLDINGDGLFKENELSVTKEFDSDSDNYEYSFRYTLNNDFVGYLDWKIEVISYEDKNKEIKTNLFGSSQYKALNEKKHIKVLQIKPNADYVKLEGNSAFENILNDNCVVNDYTIEVNTKTIKEVNEEMNKEKKDRKWQINGDYDMVIIGFGDGFGVYSDVYEDFNDSAINELKEFIKTGQSVMFTHDTMAPVFAYESILDSNNNKIITGSQNLTRNFRDYIGQSRYRDIYRSKDINNINGKIDLTDGDGKINDFDEIDLVNNKIIPHDDYPDSAAYSVGTTLQNNRWESEITKVSKINKAQINQYPFELNDEINVLSTHTQWFQLNLEDEDVVPWFNLKSNSNKFDNLDSRNNYYTYSKGNITYCGTGHIYGSSDFTNEEMKLFINTIVKAERGANHAPEIECSIPSEYKEDNQLENNVVAGSDYSFTVDARDFDGDPVELKIKIGNNDLTSDYVDMSKLEETACFLRKDDGDSELESNVFHVQSDDNDRKALKITIPKNRLSVGQKVVVEINGQDYRGAKVSKKYIINPIELPKFDVSVNLDTDNLRKTVNPSLLDKMDDKTVKVTPGDIVNVPYDVNMREIEYGEVRETSRKEVAILVDTSVSDGNLKTQFKNGIVNELINTNIILNNNATEDNGRFLMIAYGGDEVKRVESSGGNNYREKLQLSVYKLFDDINQGDMSNKEPQLANAINEAINFFDESNWNDSSKDIIIISNRDINESSVNSIRGNIKDNYNVITLDISEDAYDEGNDNYTEQEHIELLNRHKNLRKVHSLLGGLDNNYFISRTEKKGQTTHNDIANKIFAEIAKHIGYLKYPTFTLDNMYVNFNIGSDIDYIEDSEDGFNKKNSNTEDYNYVVDLPKMKYVVKMDSENKPVTSNGKLVYEPYFINDSFETSEANEYGFSFKISAKNVDKDKCCFSQPNEILYDYLGYNTSIKKDVDKTPVLLLDNCMVDHGIYKRITGGKAEFDDSNNKYQVGSIVTCASNITQMVNSKDLSIIIDPDLEFVKTPKIYKVDSEGKLKAVSNGDYFKVSDNQYSYSDFNGATNNNVVVLYSVKLKSKQGDSYVNISRAGNKEARVSILKKTESEQLGDLPDLF